MNEIMGTFVLGDVVEIDPERRKILGNGIGFPKLVSDELFIVCYLDGFEYYLKTRDGAQIGIGFLAAQLKLADPSRIVEIINK